MFQKFYLLGMNLAKYAYLVPIAVRVFKCFFYFALHCLLFSCENYIFAIGSFYPLLESLRFAAWVLFLDTGLSFKIIKTVQEYYLGSLDFQPKPMEEAEFLKKEPEEMNEFEREIYNLIQDQKRKDGENKR